MQTYRAVLNGDRLEWLDELPHPQRPVEVKILVEESAEQGNETRIVNGTMNGLINTAEMNALLWDVSCDRPVPSRFE